MHIDVSADAANSADPPEHLYASYVLDDFPSDRAACDASNGFAS
jgi:hypothetical protein